MSKKPSQKGKHIMSITKKYWSGDPITDWSRGARLDLRFSLACDIVKHCALVVGVEDGEDSAGRRAMKLLPATAVADRAIAIADRLVEVAEQKGYLAEPVLGNAREASNYHRVFNRDPYSFRDQPEKDEAAWAALPKEFSGKK